MARLLSISIFILVFLKVTTAAWAVDYKVIILHPETYDSSAAYGISGAQQVGYAMAGDQDYAILWFGTSDNFINLHPDGFTSTEAYGISGGQQVGQGQGSSKGGEYHALIWSGTHDSVIDLNPTGFRKSLAFGICDNHQVGWGFPDSSGLEHALLWSGSSSSVVDLHPEGFTLTRAYAISGSRQVGLGKIFGGPWVALLWSGSAENVENLHSDSFDETYAFDISGGQQVGYGTVSSGYEFHALLWSGTADSVVDLHPSGCSESVAYSVSSSQQVGNGWFGNQSHALLWFGTAESVVDLHSFLPDGYSSSYAIDVDSRGNIVGFADLHAVMWVPLIYVGIDIKPGSYSNSINLGNEGVIPVAILSSWEFGATTVDPATVELAGAGVELRGKSDKAMAHKEDSNGDGFIDLVVQITTQNLDPGTFQDGYATLTGSTYDGTAIEGSDEINIVPK